MTRAAAVGLGLALAACAGRAAVPAPRPPANTGGGDRGADRPVDPLALGRGDAVALVGTVTDEQGATHPARWDLTVEGVFVRAAQTAWVVGGWPITRVWGDPDRALATIVVLRDGQLWLAHARPDELAAARAAIGDGRLPANAAPFARWPLRAGDELCPDRDAPLMCWTVARDGDDFHVTLRTNPDDTTYVLHPERGLVGFRYHHHGTINDVELRREAPAP